METPKKQLPEDNSASNSNGVDTATASSSRLMGSPKTPVRTTFDDSYDDYETDELESPQFPHLIPVYNRRNTCEYDLEGVRIGWDDGFGSVFYRDEDHVSEYRPLKRTKSGKLLRRRNRTMFEPNKFNSSPQENSPSPRTVNLKNAAIQEELNDYLSQILKCLSAKKRARELLKSKNDTNNSTENSAVHHLLNDSADDEMLLMCSQAIEKTLETDPNFCSTPTKIAESNSLSIAGITPLKDINNAINNNVYHHVAKKFKPIPCKYLSDKKNKRSPCHTITSNTENKLPASTNNNSLSTTNTVTNSNKDDSSLLFNDPLADEDDFFLSIDLSEIEQQILISDKKNSLKSDTQKCNSQQYQKTGCSIQSRNKQAVGTSTVKSSSSSLLWRRSSSSSSIVKPGLQQQNIKSYSGVNGTLSNSKVENNAGTTSTTKRYCTPAEIEAKRERARRTLMLKFKSKNRSIS